jgi:hypothetical protein
MGQDIFSCVVRLEYTSRLIVFDEQSLKMQSWLYTRVDKKTTPLFHLTKTFAVPRSPKEACQQQFRITNNSSR